MVRRLALAGLIALLPALASAQLATIAPTAPNGDNSNRIATTAFVLANAGGGGSLALASGQIFIGSAGGVATGQTPSGDFTLSNSGVATLATVNANTGAIGSATQCVTVTNNAKGLTTAVTAATCTPAIGSITGLGTGVATALAINTGTAGSHVVNGGALGTPSSGTLTSATGLPLSTGVTGTLGFANGGTNATTQAAAINNLHATPTRAGDIEFWNGTAWATLAGNNSGTQVLQENASGVPSWATISGSGTVTSVTCFGAAITTSGTCVTQGQLPGIGSNTVASAGNIGEVMAASVPAGSAGPLTTGVATNIISLTLTPGHWQVSGTVCFAGGTSTSIVSLEEWISATSATQPTFPNFGAVYVSRYAVTLSAGQDSLCAAVGPLDVHISASTTHFLTAQANFGTSTLSAYGYMQALRVQ